MKIVIKFLKLIYKFLGLNRFRRLNYYLIFYILNFKKTKKDIILKKTNFNKLDKKQIHNFKNKFKDEACVIIGNGPSLNNMDLTKLHNVKTLASIVYSCYLKKFLSNQLFIQLKTG